MSAHVVDKQTIDELVQALKQYGLCDLDTEAGQLLWDANVDSVDYRYAESTEPGTYTYAYRARPTTLGQVARSLTNYVYQSCEHPGWPGSEAREMCIRLAFELVEHVPGYSEAVSR